MIKYILISLLLATCLADCPLNHYPRQTVIGYIQAQIDNSPTIHQNGQDYIYALSDPLPKSSVSLVISVIGFEINPSSGIHFNVAFLPNSDVNHLNFRVKVVDQNFGWRSLRCNFIASLNPMFSMTIKQNLAHFSTGTEQGSYSVYQAIPNFKDYSLEPVVKVFLSGIDANPKPLDTEEIRGMENQLASMKMFSANPRLVKLLEESLEIKKGLQFKISDAKNVGSLLGFKIQTNMELISVSFSYIVFSNLGMRDKHNSIIGDFILVDQKEQKISVMSNMGMLLVGLTQFTIPQNTLYNFEVSFEEIFNQGYFKLLSNKPYFELGFTYMAFEMQRKFVCDDCVNSPIIYEERYCVEACPRGFSKIQRLQNTYCDKCEIEKLKVVDFQTQECVCARRHYLDLADDTCKPCSYDCYTCNTADRCLTCDNQMFQTKRTMNSQGRCKCPSVGYYDNTALEDIVCEKCDVGCRTCDGPRAHDCLTCGPGRQLDTHGFCICSKGFESAPDGSCICPAPKVLFSGFCTTDSTNCGPNQEAQLVDLTRRCICKVGFIQVLNDCIKCGGNSQFDSDSLTCKCKNKTVYENGQCVPCGVNQEFDEILGICKCADSTFKDDNGNCITCAPRMGYINGKCQCAFNYFQITPGVCKRCQRQTDGPLCRKNYEIILQP